MKPSNILTKDRIITALDTLDKRLPEKGVTGEVSSFGGETMILAFAARESTRDFDAVFVPKTETCEAAANPLFVSANALSRA